MSVVPLVAAYSDPAPVAQYLSGLQQRGIALAHWGKYHAQFDFTGRLKPVTEIGSVAGLQAWLKKNPQGRIMMFEDQAYVGAHSPEFERFFRGGYLQVWGTSALYTARSQAAP